MRNGKGRNTVAKVGYIRVSTIRQNTGRQEVAMPEDVRKVFIDHQSGKDADRPNLKACFAFLREGDTLIVESISRFARNTRDLLSLVAKLQEMDVAFVSLKENIDTQTPQGRFMLTIFAACAELEREQILERQAEGIALAKAAGKYKGRVPVQYDADALKAACSEWDAETVYPPTPLRAPTKIFAPMNPLFRAIEGR